MFQNQISIQSHHSDISLLDWLIRYSITGTYWYTPWCHNRYSQNCQNFISCTYLWFSSKKELGWNHFSMKWENFLQKLSSTLVWIQRNSLHVCWSIKNIKSCLTCKRKIGINWNFGNKPFLYLLNLLRYFATVPCGPTQRGRKWPGHNHPYPMLWNLE